MLGDDRMVDGHELRPVGERALDLDLGDHLGDAVEHLVRAEQPAAEVHELGDRPAVTDELEQLRRDERHRLDIVQPHAAREPLLREEPRLVEDQLVDFTRGQMHSTRAHRI